MSSSYDSLSENLKAGGKYATFIIETAANFIL